MARAIYPEGKDAIGTAVVNLTSSDIRIILVDTASYTYSTSHAVLSDVAAGARVATSGAISGKTLEAGLFLHSNVTLTAVSGAVSEALIYYHHTGVAATSPLIYYCDEGDGLPITPDGRDIEIVPDATNGVFRL